MDTAPYELSRVPYGLYKIKHAPCVHRTELRNPHGPRGLKHRESVIERPMPVTMHIAGGLFRTDFPRARGPYGSKFYGPGTISTSHMT